MSERKIRFRVEEGTGFVRVSNGPYVKEFDPKRMPPGGFEATEQEWDLYLKHFGSLKIIREPRVKPSPRQSEEETK